MTEAAKGRMSLKEEFSALGTKQLIAIIVALALALILEVLGFASMCIGFLIVAVLLYMIPHLLGVTSVKIKAIVGVIFIVLSLLIGTFLYTGINEEAADRINNDYDYVKDISYDESTGTLTMTLVPVDGEELVPTVSYGTVSGIAFGGLRSTDLQTKDIDATKITSSNYKGTVQLDLPSGKFCLVSVYVDEEKKNGAWFTVDTGASGNEMMSICFVGAAYLTAYIAAMYFIILIFSALMRRSLGKTREKMEEDGRLYPQGYGRCKKCGAIVLPGEVNCRKCGEYIDVPEEFRPKKKDKFVCSECGCEITEDATICPKCGKVFDDEIESEITHADGTVDTSTEVFECSECGAKVPANAKRCPKCGAVFDEDDE